VLEERRTKRGENIKRLSGECVVNLGGELAEDVSERGAEKGLWERPCYFEKYVGIAGKRPQKGCDKP